MDVALRLFAADQIVIATPSRGRPNWLMKDVGARARSRLVVPILVLPVAAAA
jgi:hypothetical protein